MRRLIFPILLGLAGCGVLISLGTWQLERLDWKRGILDIVESRIAMPPVQLDGNPTEADTEYSAVTVTGEFVGPEIHVLASGTAAGTGYRVIRAFSTTDGRRILVDAGLLPLEAKEQLPLAVGLDASVAVTGNLLWPDDAAQSSPAPDLAANIWFARDLPAMADALGTEPLMIVLSSTSQPDPRLTPLPVDTSGIKNDHREYAITWFGLALVWAAMSVFLIVRTIRRKE